MIKKIFFSIRKLFNFRKLHGQPWSFVTDFYHFTMSEKDSRRFEPCGLLIRVQVLTLV